MQNSQIFAAKKQRESGYNDGTMNKDLSESVDEMYGASLFENKAVGHLKGLYSEQLENISASPQTMRSSKSGPFPV